MIDLMNNNLLDMLSDGIVSVNSDSCINYSNEAARSLSGWEGESSYGVNIERVFVLLKYNDRSVLLSPYTELIEQFNTGSNQGVYILLSKSAKEYLVSITVTINDNNAGDKKSYILIYKNITENENAKQELADNKKNFTSLFHGLHHGVALHEMLYDHNQKPINYRYLDINSSFEQIMGLKRNQIIGCTVLELFPDTEQYWIELYANVVQTGKSQHFENYSKSLNKYFEVTAYSPKEGQFAVIVSDITEKKEKIKKEYLEKQMLENILTLAPVAIVKVNNDNKIDYVNKSATELLQLTDKKSIDELFDNFKTIESFSGETIDINSIPFSIVKKTHESVYNLHYIYTFKNNEVKHLLINAAPLFNKNSLFNGVILIYQDITEELNYKMKLEETEIIFNAFMEHSPIYIFFKDSEAHPIRLSKNYIDLLGKPIDQILGKSMLDLFPAELATKMIEDDMQVLNAKEPVHIVEKLNDRVYDSYKFPLNINNGPQYLAGYTIDITERSRSEEQVKNLLKEKEIMLKEVHHRLKNNMNAIENLLEYQAQLIDNSDAKVILLDAQKRIQSISVLYDKLSLSSVYNSISFKEYLNSLIEEISIISSTNRSIQFILEIDDFIIDVFYIFPLGLIINEIISNATKHAFINQNEAVISTIVQKKNSIVTITVSDNGIGIPEGLDFTTSSGFGLNLIGLLANQIDAKLELIREHGTIITVIFEIGKLRTLHDRL